MNLKSKLIWALRCGQSKATLGLSADVRTQLHKFNAIWHDAVMNVPFYSDWKDRYGLPDKVTHIEELKLWPILEKRELMQNRDKLIRKDVLKSYENVTGGSTGEPLHFRTMSGESDIVAANKWIGWARMGIFPDSRCFLLWGHRHGHGQGIVSHMHFLWRRCKDWMTNNLRVDATNLSMSALRCDVEKLIRFRPECIIAYSASLLALVRSCSEYKEQCNRLGVKAVICTAGPLSRNERDEISAFFNSPVGMEYGSMEAGVMAYQTPMTNGRYEVFGHTHIVHAVPECSSGRSRVLVTKIYPCYMPLIRYDIGDSIQGPTFDVSGLVVGFDEVYGRTGDEVDMGDGVKFHGQSFMLCAEGNDKVVAYQLRIKRRERRVVFAVQTIEPLTDAEKFVMRKQTSEMSGLEIDAISIEEAKELVKAPSGKIRLVVEEA